MAKRITLKRLTNKEFVVRLYLFLAILVILAFFILFTPFSFWLARPLYVNQRIEKADCALVLAGGSYPKGQLSSFSLERTIQAVKFYKQGLISKVFFSGRSGPDRDDAQSMSQMANFLGIDISNIIIENRSGNTFENINFSLPLLQTNGCRTVLLVTSPTHLRRSLMIVEKMPSGIIFLPAPTPSYDEYRSHPLDRLILFWFTTREYLGIMLESFRR